MPAPDLYHDIVKRALVKDDWQITDDPYYIQYKGLRLYADIGAERPLGAEKGDKKIVVEIKVFGSASQITELERALGQYSIYRGILKKIEPARIIYLAIAQDVFEDFFLRPAIQDIVADIQVNFVVFDPTQEKIVQWIE